MVLEDGLLVSLCLPRRDLALAVDPPDGFGQLLDEVASCTRGLEMTAS